jgi:hypothetical protein
MEAPHPTASSPRRWQVLRRSCVLALAAVCMAAVSGCDGGEPRCACEPKAVEILDVPVGGRKGAAFTVTNSGDGGRLSWYIEPVYQSTLGLSFLERSTVYVLEEGQSAEFTFLFRPTKVIEDTTVSIRVGLDECVIDVRLSADEFPPECTVTMPLVAFSTAVGDTAEHVLHVINTGGGRVAGTVSPQGCGSPFSVVAQRTSFNLAPGDSNAVTVRYLPAIATGEGTANECTIDLGTACDPVVVRGVAFVPDGAGR